MTLNPWVWLSALLALALLIGVLFIQRGQIQAAEARQHAAEIERDVAKAANTELAAAVARLQKDNDELANGRRADREAAAAAVQREQVRAAGLQRELEAARGQREEIYAKDPDAAEWGRQRMPAAIAERLRH